jgi:hypothetical protein
MIILTVLLFLCFGFFHIFYSKENCIKITNHHLYNKKERS